MTQFKFFSIPIAGDDSLESELNSFLRSVRVVSKTVQLSSSGAQPCWGICVEYFSSDYVKGSVPPRGKRASSSIDYREVLSEENFVVFARLREVRKAIAEEKGYPPGTFKVWEEDRILILTNLFLIREELLDKLRHFPVDYFLRSIGIRNRRRENEKKLDEIDYAIRIFQLTDVYLKM